MARLSKCFLTGDFRDWPLDQETACEIVRVRFVGSDASAADKYLVLKVRSRKVKEMANIYIQRHIQDLGARPHVLKLQARPNSDVAARFKEHIENRVNAHYPESHFGSEEGAVPQLLRDAIAEQQKSKTSSGEPGFDMKQATMPDTPVVGASLFNSIRPSIVVGEGAATNTFVDSLTAEAAIPKVADMDIPVLSSKEFEDQFISHYCARVFPWALNYDCGGADYPDLFADWEMLGRQLGAETVQA